MPADNRNHSKDETVVKFGRFGAWIHLRWTRIGWVMAAAGWALASFLYFDTREARASNTVEHCRLAESVAQAEENMRALRMELNSIKAGQRETNDNLRAVLTAMGLREPKGGG